jgi:hypothetical protein
MHLSLWRARGTSLLVLAFVFGVWGGQAQSQESGDADRPPKSVRGTLVNVNPRNNTIVVNSDEGQALSWRFEKNVIDEAAKFEEGARVIVIYRLLPGDVKRVTALAFPGVEKTPIYVNLTDERVVVRSAPRVNEACDEAGGSGVTETVVPRGGRAEVLEGCWCCAVAGQTCPTTTRSGLGRAYLVQCFE